MAETSPTPPLASPPEHAAAETWYLVARLVGYAAVVGLTFQAFVVAAGRGAGAALAVEDGPLETLQLVLAATSAGLLLAASRRATTASRGFALLGLVCAFFAVRELDHVFDVVLWHGAWKWPAAPLVVGAVVVVWRTRSRLGEELRALARTPTFHLAFFGLLVIVVYAQVLGQKELWQAVMGDHYERPVKDLVEEATELLGYLLLAFAAVEAVLHARRGPQDDGRRLTPREGAGGSPASR